MVFWTELLTQPLLPIPQRLYLTNLRPEVVVWNVTSHCNLHCQHCYIDAHQTQDTNGELSLKEAKEFIRDLAKLKVAVLLFSGGEALLRKDLFTLAKFAKDAGVKPALSTNGTLISQKVAKKIKQAGFYYVGISLDGREEVNDRFRRSNGAFKAALTGIRNCKEVGLKVGLRFTLTKYNVRDLTSIFELAEREGISRLCIYHLVYTGRARKLKKKDLNHKEKRQALELIWQKTQYFLKKKLNIEVLTVDNHADGAWVYLKLKELDPQRAHLAWEILKAQGGNSAGIKIASVDDCGNIYADQFLRSYPLGNIRIKKFSQAWLDPDNSLLSALRNRMPYLSERCQRCSFIKICNGNFRARAEAVSGNLWQDDPACYLTEEEIHQDAQVYSPLDCLGVNA